MNMPDKLWDLANLITGFAVVQSVAFIFGLVSDNLKLLKGREAHWFAAGGTALFTVGYVVAVLLCGCEAQSFDSTNQKQIEVWHWVTSGRVLAIVVFGALAIGTTYVHWRDKYREQQVD